MSPLSSNGAQIDQHPDLFGMLRDSSKIEDSRVLRSRFRDEGYVLVRGLIDPSTVDRARSVLHRELAERELVQPSPDTVTAVANAGGHGLYEVLENINGHEAFKALAGDDSILRLASSILGTQAKVWDYIWPRAVGPGKAADPHCDWVYMSRGSRNLVSLWAPLTNIPLELGPLMILENSHLDVPAMRAYRRLDADRLGRLGNIRLKHGQLIQGAKFSGRPDKVRDEIGGRWLTTSFSAGDLIFFNPMCMHGTLDNQTELVRMSLDMRFQPEDEPMDPRFSGPNHIGHRDRQKSIFSVVKELLAKTKTK